MDKLPLTAENLKYFDFITSAAISMFNGAASSTDSNIPSCDNSLHRLDHTEGNEYACCLHDRNCKRANDEEPKNYEQILAALQQGRDDELSDEDARDLIYSMHGVANDSYIETLIIPEVINPRKYLSHKSAFRL